MPMCSKEEKIKCIGCNQYDPENHDDSWCGRPPEYESQSCPCLNCVIKMICDYECGPYEDYHRFVLKRVDEKKRVL